MYKQQVVRLTELQHLLPELRPHHNACWVVGVVEQKACALLHSLSRHFVKVWQPGLSVAGHVMGHQASYLHCKM